VAASLDVLIVHRHAAPRDLLDSSNFATLTRHAQAAEARSPYGKALAAGGDLRQKPLPLVWTMGRYVMSGDSITIISGLFRQFGDQHYGEAVNQRDHMLQCAQRAAEDGADDPMIAAALLHDVGHLLENAGPAADNGIDAAHESLGAAFLSQYFPLSVTRPIALHVAAKRYLSMAESGYLDALSPASRHSLYLQGGPFDAAEAATFVADPFSAQALRLRRYDEGAKHLGAATPPLEAYLPLLNSLTL
jgi:phosphonate degradation associated HDIG domain protein